MFIDKILVSPEFFVIFVEDSGKFFHSSLLLVSKCLEFLDPLSKHGILRAELEEGVVELGDLKVRFFYEGSNFISSGRSGLRISF